MGRKVLGLHDRIRRDTQHERKRGSDLKPRKRRICMWCELHHPSTKDKCKGRGGEKFCTQRNIV